MPRWSINQQMQLYEDFLPTETYADTILRTFASLKPSVPSTVHFISQKDRQSPSISIDSSLDEPVTSSELISLKKQSTKLRRLFSRLDKLYRRTPMTIKTLLPSSDITDRYLFRSHSNDPRILLSTNHEQYPPSHSDLYRFPNEPRAHSSDSDRYYFPSDQTLRPTLPYQRSRKAGESRSVTFLDGTSTSLSDTPYLFSKTNELEKHYQTTSTHTHPEKRIYERRVPRNVGDSSVRASKKTSGYRTIKRMDTVTSTNGSLSLLRRWPKEKPSIVHFEPSSKTPARPTRKGHPQALESFERSVDRLVSSVNKKYGQQHYIIPSISSSSTYLSQYYAKEDQPSIDYSIGSDHERYTATSNLIGNGTHSQIMKSVNKSLIDGYYQVDTNRMTSFDRRVRRSLRFYENQSLQREISHDLIRCFSCSYLQDVRREDIRYHQMRTQLHSYTYEDIQDIHVPTNLEVYKMRRTVDRERRLMITGRLSPSLEYGPLISRSSSEHLDGYGGSFQTDSRSRTSVSQTPTMLRPNLDLFYEIMQESFRGIDASIAHHISQVSHHKLQDNDSDVSIKSTSSFWSDDDVEQHPQETNQRKTIPNQRQLSRYLSTVNRSLLDHPSSLITDFYLANLNRSMQESVRHIETIARDKVRQRREWTTDRQYPLGRSLSADHLYQVRKEHLRYKQPFDIPTSFTAEDVADIYKPFVLENYKRKIAIELERRRRLRQRQSSVGLHSPLVYTSESELNERALRSSHPPMIDQGHFVVGSPPFTVNTKEIIMGRARRTVADDGSGSIIHHAGIIAPPTIYSSDPRQSLDRKQTHIYNEQEQIITSHRPQTNIYTYRPSTKTMELSRANLIESESGNQHFSTVKIQSIETFNQYEVNEDSLSSQYSELQPNMYQYATIINPLEQPLSSADQFYNEQVTQFDRPVLQHERSTLIMPVLEHVAKIQEDNLVFELLPTLNQTTPATDRVKKISRENETPLYTSRINEPPVVLHSSHSASETAIDESLAVWIQTTIDNNFPSTSLAFILDEISPTDQIQQARGITESNHFWKTCDVALPIIDNQESLVNNYLSQHFLDIQESEQITSFSTDSNLLQNEQQLNIRIDPSPRLEFPLRPEDVLIRHLPEQMQSFISEEECFPILDSRTSSYHDMETFLNQFEASLDHEGNSRSLPAQCFQPIVLSRDEQLVEQWTVDNHLDTIQHQDTLPRRQFTDASSGTIAPTDTFRFELDSRENPYFTTDDLSHCSLSSADEVDSVTRDNDTTTMIPARDVLPSSSLITNTSFLSQTSPPLSSYTAPVLPIVYFLDALAVENHHPTKDILRTLGFGQQEKSANITEMSSTISTVVQPQQPTWINRSVDHLRELPLIIHQENESPLLIEQQQHLHFPLENQIEKDETALLIYPHRLQFGHDLGENIHGPLKTIYEPAYLHLPIVNEVYIYQMSFHHEFALFHPPDAFPHMLPSQIEHEAMLSSDDYQLHQTPILSFAHTTDLVDYEEDIQAIAYKLTEPNYIEHYHIQSLYPFAEICYAHINETEIFSPKGASSFLALKDYFKNENDFNPIDALERQATRKTEKSPTFHFPTSTLPIEVRPPAPTERGPIYEGLSVVKTVDVNDSKGQYRQHARYDYGSEQNNSTKYTTIHQIPEVRQAPVQPTHSNRKDVNVIQSEIVTGHVSEDEKSTSSEEVVFEEWSEEFKCRRTDEFDTNSNRLLRTTIDETSERVKSDVLKEEYKEKRVRRKGHKDYDVVNEILQNSRRSDSIQMRPYEEVFQPPHPLLIQTTTLSSSPPPATDRKWTTEEIYTTEVVSDSNLPKDKQPAISNYNRVRPGQYSPIPPTTQAVASTTPSSSSHYERISNVVTPTFRYADVRRPEPAEVVTEEYHVEIDTEKNRGETSEEDFYGSNDRASLNRQNSDWRNKLKEIYTPPGGDQHEKEINGSYLAQRVSVVPSTSDQQEHVEEVQIKVPTRAKTPPEPKKSQLSPSSRHTVKEIVVSLSRGSASVNANEQKKKKLSFLLPETSPKASSTSPTDDDRSQTLKRSPYSSSSSFFDDRRTQFEQATKTDRPTVGRVGELKNAFETTATGSTKDETSKYQVSRTSGFTEQRRRMFEEQDQTKKEWTRRPINEFHSNERRISETHTAPSTSYIQSTDRLGRSEFDAVKFALESSIAKAAPSPQTSIDIRLKNKQVVSSLDSDLSGPSQPIYQSTPKSTKPKLEEDLGHESGDELSDSKQNYSQRQHISNTRVRDFSQATPQTPSKSDSGVYDYSSVISHYLPTGSPSGRQNISTSIMNDTTRTHIQDTYQESTRTTSPYTRRPLFDADQTTAVNDDDSYSRATSNYRTEIYPGESSNQKQQHQRNVRRQVTHSTPPPSEYENLTNYQSRIDSESRVPITTKSRSGKPLVVDQVETVETETRVEFQVQRTNDTKESTSADRFVSPFTSPQKLTRSTEEVTPTKRIPTRFQPIDRQSPPSRTYYSSAHTMEATSMSPQNQVTFSKNSPNEIVATLRVPQLDSTRGSSSTTPISHGMSEPSLYERTNEDQDYQRSRLQHQRVVASSYNPSSIDSKYQQAQSRSRVGPHQTSNEYSSPVTLPVRSASYHSSLHEQNQQQQQSSSSTPRFVTRSQTQLHSGSLGNLFGSNLEFEIEIEKRPPHRTEQPTVVSLNQSTRAVITTSKDGRVSVQNLAARPGNTIVINSDYHCSDRSLNRSSGYFSSDDQQSHTASQYHFDQVNDLVRNYSQPSSNQPMGFHETIDQIDALYNHPNGSDQPYDFSKSVSRLNRRKELAPNSQEYAQRYTSTGFQQMPATSSSLNNLVMATPILPAQPSSASSRSTQQLIQQQNRLNDQSQIVQRNRTSVKQVKQKSAAKKRYGSTQGQFSDNEDDSPLSDNGSFQQHSPPSSSSQAYYFNHQN